jgi:hypothetical protein
MKPAEKLIQRILIPDILSRKVLSKLQHAEAISDMVQCGYTYIKRVSGNNMYISIPQNVVDTNPEMYSHVFGLCKKDPAYRILLYAYKNYIEKPKNYVVTKGLTEALRRTSTDVKCSIVPDNFCGYLEIPNLHDKDGDLIGGCFVLIEDRELYCVAFSGNLNAMPHFHFKLDYSDTLSGLTKKHKYENIGLSGKVTLEDVDALDYQSIIVNAVVYITSNDADLTNRVNNFSTKKNKLETQKKIYTPSEFVSVGENFNYEIVRKSMRNNVSVSSHFRWQACGAGMKEHKLIFIRDYVKNKVK